jgi:hypothetical protein
MHDNISGDRCADCIRSRSHATCVRPDGPSKGESLRLTSGTLQTLISKDRCADCIWSHSHATCMRIAFGVIHMHHACDQMVRVRESHCALHPELCRPLYPEIDEQSRFVAPYIRNIAYPYIRCMRRGLHLESFTCNMHADCIRSHSHATCMRPDGPSKGESLPLISGTLQTLISGDRCADCIWSHSHATCMRPDGPSKGESLPLASGTLQTLISGDRCADCIWSHSHATCMRIAFGVIHMQHACDQMVRVRESHCPLYPELCRPLYPEIDEQSRFVAPYIRNIAYPYIRCMRGLVKISGWAVRRTS